MRRWGVPTRWRKPHNTPGGAPLVEIAQSSAVRFAQAAQPCQAAQPPCFAGLRLSELRWRWCSTEGSCITLRSCLAVANATLALARAQHDLHSYQAAQPSTAEVRSPPPSDPMLRYAQHCGVARSAQHATRQYKHAHQCHHDFSATSSAPTVRLDAFLCDPMVPNDSCPQPKGAHFNCSATSTTVATTALAVRTITVSACDALGVLATLVQQPPRMCGA